VIISRNNRTTIASAGAAVLMILISSVSWADCLPGQRQEANLIYQSASELLDQKQWDAALDLIYNRPPEKAVKLADGSETTDPLQIFIDLFPDGATAQSTKEDLADLPLEERLRHHIIDGEKKGVAETQIGRASCRERV